MSKIHISFGSIEAFRTIVKNVRDTAHYVGQGENNEPIFDKSRLKPMLTFKISVKIHGANASFCYNDIDNFWYQSRNNIITVENDNAGCAFFMESRKEIIKDLVSKIKREYNIDTTKNTISVFGEFCGGNIQKGVAITGLPKMFVIFGLKISPFDEDINAYWLDHSFEIKESFGTTIALKSVLNDIYNVEQFYYDTIDIDFNQPELIQNKLIEITNQVEEECPVGKYFGRVKGTDNTTGEGIVLSCRLDNGSVIKFKSKGEAHSTSKVKVINSVDIEKINSINEFIEYSVTENRLNQGIEYVFTQQSKEPNIKEIADFIRWVHSDIIKEELDTLVANNLEPKDIGKAVADKARKFFMNKLNNFKD